MNRLNAGLVLLIGLLVAPLATEAQQSGRVYRLGYLSTPTRESVEHGLAAFLRTLRELGWIDGQNLIIEYRWAEGNVERLPGLAAELVRNKVDVIVAPAGSAALAAKNATSSIPIVMIFAPDPVETGHQLQILLMGAIVSASRGDHDAAQRVGALADLLLERAR